jgi:hypothetical protein
MTKRQSEIDMRKESKSVLRTIDRIQRSMKRKLGFSLFSLKPDLPIQNGRSALP